MENMKPILFSGPMVRAILSGQKTMTRRVIKQNVVDNFLIGVMGILVGSYREGMAEAYPTVDDAPYQVDDILWVRETWRINAWSELDQKIQVDYKADGSSGPRWIFIDNEELFDRLWTQSTEDAENAGYRYNQFGHYEWEDGSGPCRWRPSIFMPKQAARIFLRVTAVRAERLQDISTGDIYKEGALHPAAYVLHETEESFLEAIGADQSIREYTWAVLWDSINKKRGYGWDTNPWVWVYEFERITKECTI